MVAISLKKPEVMLIKQIIRGVFEAHIQRPFPSVWLFGSRARSSARKNSDLDILLRCEETIPLEVFTYLAEAFENSDLPFQVDIVDARKLDSDFLASIMKYAVELNLERDGA